MAEHVKFLFNTEWMVNIRKIKDREQQLDLFLAIVDFAETGTHSELPFESDLVIEPIKAEILRYQSNYKHTCDTNRKIAINREQKKREDAERLAELEKVYGGENSDHERARTCTNVNERERTSPPNPNPNPNPNVSEAKASSTLKENTLTSVKEKAGQNVFCPPVSEEVREFMSLYVSQKRNEGVFYNPPTTCHEDFMDFYASKNWMVGKNKMKDWRAAARRWVREQQNYTRHQKPRADNIHFAGENDRSIYEHEEDNWK